ncbi:MAG TPA: hypothetical protein VFA33_11900 [Bryobacteraceae bacterium]|nr:hypothetical protein [Bryobacteraceae bacterium]
MTIRLQLEHTPAVAAEQPARPAAHATAEQATASADPPEVNRFYEMFDPKNWERPTTAGSQTPSNTVSQNPAQTAGPQSVPTVEGLFGPNPWQTNPTGYGPNGQTWSYNPLYFATRQTAETVAQMVGGTVVEQNQFCPSGPLVQAQPNEMVQLPNGRVFNAGEFVGLFSHGYPQSYVDRLIQQELTGEVKG